MGAQCSKLNCSKNEDGSRGLSAEKQKEFALKGIKDTLELAAELALKKLQKQEMWEKAEFKIPLPHQDKVDKLEKDVGAVPLVGGKLAAELAEQVAKVAKDLLGAALEIAASAKTLECFKEVIGKTNPADALALIANGKASEFVDDLKTSAMDAIKKTLAGPVRAILEKNALMKTWMEFKGKMQFVCDKSPVKPEGGNPMELDIVEYTMEKSVLSILAAMKGEEEALRKNPLAATSDYAKQVLSNLANPSQWKFPGSSSKPEAKRDAPAEEKPAEEKPAQTA